MDWLVDTSVLVRTIHTGSPQQQIAIDALAALRTQNDTLCVFPQNLVEFWVVATRPTDVNGLGLTAEEAKRQLDQIKLHFVFKKEDETVFENWESLVRNYEVRGKTAHDTRLVAAMQTHNITHVLTFNISDFTRYLDIVKAASPKEIVSVSEDSD